MSTLRVTVAVITFNRSEYLKETLAGLVRQDYPAGCWELLVIDNNSTDDTRDVVASFMASMPSPRWILEERAGLDNGRNRAVQEAGGEIIALVDDDIIVKPDWLPQLVAPFLADSARAIGVVGGEVVPIFPDGIPDWLKGSHKPLRFRPDAGRLQPDQAPMGANFAFPKWVFDRLGGFDTELDRRGALLFGGGDAEMVRRVRAAGFEAWFAPGASVLHQIPAGRLTLRYALRHAFDSARSRVVDKARIQRNAGRSALPFLLSRAAGSVCKLAWFLAAAGVLAVVLRGGPAKRALVRAWRCCGYLCQIARSAAGKV
jgi:glycosyltransferase involved in cell wall biosynthesis